MTPFSATREEPWDRGSSESSVMAVGLASKGDSRERTPQTCLSLVEKMVRISDTNNNNNSTEMR